MVRDALVGSVACTSPPVSFQISQLSTVPNARPSGESTACSSSQASLVAEK